MATVTYLVFDLAHVGDPTQTTDKAFAFADFAERQMDGDAVILIAHVQGERPEDLTHEATENAAMVFLEDADEYSDIPNWVAETDAYDAWCEDIAYSAADNKLQHLISWHNAV